MRLCADPPHLAQTAAVPSRVFGPLPWSASSWKAFPRIQECPGLQEVVWAGVSHFLKAPVYNIHEDARFHCLGQAFSLHLTLVKMNKPNTGGRVYAVQLL